MKINKVGYLTSLSNDTVVDCGNNHSFYKITTLIDELSNFFKQKQWCNKTYFYVSCQTYMRDYQQIDLKQEIFTEEGIETEIIDPKLNKPVKGKFRIAMVLEFIPDESQGLDSNSPLDEIRQQMQSGD